MRVSAVPEKPRLLVASEIERGTFFRRFRLALLLVVTVSAAYVALDLAAARGVSDLRLLDAGKLAAIVLIFLLGVRGLFNLVRGLTTRSEAARFYDQGFVWSRGKSSAKYAWHDLVSFRDSTRGLYFRRRPIFQTGALTLRMKDGKSYRFGGRFGDTRPCAKAVRRYAAYVTGIRLGRSLRAGKTVALGRRLTVYPAGVDTGKHIIPWDALDIRHTGHRLTVRQRVKGKWQVIQTYNTRRIDNVGGFLELAAETIRIHQPDRRKAEAQKAAAGVLE